MDLETKKSLSSWDEDAWMHIPGAMAWAPLPTPLPSVRDRFNNGKHLDFWPCILYPSWSDALGSPDIPVPNELLLLGCKKPVPTAKLKENIVPGKMALGPSELIDTDQGKCKRRKKLVCYFLGMGDEGWCAVHTKDVRRYEWENCIEILKTYKDMTAIDETENAERIWRELIVAMKEASLALSNPRYDPSVLCKSSDIGTTSKDVDDDGSNSKLENCTPECFDDWRVGGNTQSMTMTQGASRFSLQTQSQSKTQD